MAEKESKSFRIGNSMLTEDDLKVKVVVNGETFTLKYPNNVERAIIEAEIARRLGGFPRSSFSADHLARIEACVIVDQLYVPEGCPSWFEGPWASYDDSLVLQLYDGYLSFRDGLRKKLRAGEFERARGGAGT